MKKISSEFLSKKLKLFEVLIFFSILIIITIVGRSIFADDVPAAPTNLTVNGTPTSTVVSLQWVDNASNEDRFNIDRKLSTATDWTSVTQIQQPDVTSYIDTYSFVPGTSYDYRVQACLSGTGCSEYTVLTGVQIPVATPIPPTGLVLNGTPTSVTVPLMWSETSTGISFFAVERKVTGATSDFIQVGAPTGMVYIDQYAFVPGTSYDYRVKACISTTMCSTYSSVLTVQIPTSGGGGTPTPPTNLTYGAITYSTVPLTWSETSTGILYYVLERKLTSGSSSFLQVGQPTGMSYTDTYSFVPGTSYDYRVKAFNGSNYSAYSSILSVMIPGGGNNPPPPPSTLTYNTTGTMPPVILNWTMQSGTGMNMFNLQKRITGTSAFSPIASLGYSVLTYTDANVVSGTSYDYQINACMSGNTNCSAFTQLIGVQVPGGGGGGIPAAPTNLTATVNGNNVILNWTDNSSNEAGFKIYRGPTWTDIGNVGTNITTFTDVNRPAGTTWTYHINAFNSNNVYSPISNDVSATIPTGGGGGGTPVAPTGLIINGTVTSTSVPLIWTDNSSIEDSFKIYRRLVCTPSCTYMFLSSTASNIVTFSDTTVSPGFFYDYQVQACLGTNCSSYITLTGVSVPTSGNGQNIPNPPTGLALNGTITSNSVPLHWTDNSNNEDSFKIEKKITGSTTNFGYIGQVGTSITNFTDTVVTPGTSYDYRVQACLNSVGCSTYSILSGILVPTSGSGGGSGSGNIPLSPSNLVQANTTTGVGISLQWTDNSSNEDKFNIERKLSTASVWSTLIQIQQPNVTFYTDMSVLVNLSYDYRVQACLSGTGCSPYVTLSGVLVPNNNMNFPSVTAPTYTSVLYTSVILGASVTSLGTSALLFRGTCLGTTPAPTTNCIDASGTGIGTFTHIRTGLTAGTTYFFRGYATNANGTAYSQDSTFTTLNISPNIPAAPTNLILNNISTPAFMSIYWTDNSNNEDKFNIERKLNSANSWAPLSQVGSNIIFYIDTTAIPDLSYDYRVQACLSGTGCSSYAYLYNKKIITTLTTVLPTSGTTAVPLPTTTNQISPNSGVAASGPNPTQNTNIIPNTPANNIPTTLDTLPVNNIEPNPSVSVSEAPMPSETSNKTDSQVDTSISAPPTETSQKIQNLGLVVEKMKKTVNDTKEQLEKTINENVNEIIKTIEARGQKIDAGKIYILRDELINKIDSTLLSLAGAITTEDINNLEKEINKGIDNIKTIAVENATSESVAITQINNSTSFGDITQTLNTLSQTVSTQNEALKSQGGDLLYKDTNKDGISDYDSVYVYNMNPTTPSPVSSYEGKDINAGDKIILGFNPALSEIVKVEKEQPVEAPAPVVSTYKVKEMALTEKKEVVIKGQALPNSFVTIYIYSTPIMVTVKTDSKGEWQYVLNKELENGDHTIYTASVNNSGNIIAKSSGYLFTKTAEAVTLKDAPLIGAPIEANRPGLLDGINLYIIIIAFLAIIILILILIGISNKKNKEQVGN